MRPALPAVALALTLVASLAAPASAAAAPSPDTVLDITFPVAGDDVRYTESYEASRGGGRLHKASDLMAPPGTPVHAAVGGTIRFITGLDGAPPSYGYMISVAGDDGMEHNYIHLGQQDKAASSAYAPGLGRGTRVSRGQLIGYVGCSGSASCGGGEHLHYEIEDPRYASGDDHYDAFRYDPHNSLLAAQRRGDVPGGAVPTPVRVAGAGEQGTYHPMEPVRLLDTREGLGGAKGRIAPRSSIEVPVAGTNGIPATATAVAVNVTVTEPTANGYVTVSPAGEGRPETSTVNFAAGRTVPNMTVVKLGSSGSLDVFNFSGRSHVLLDIAGYYTPTDGSTFVPSSPTRVLDTRRGLNSRRSPVGHRETRDVQLTGEGPIPDRGVVAVALNVTATGATARSSYVTVYPSGTERPTTSNLNIRGGADIPNVVIAKVGDDGAVSVYNHSGTTDLVFDVAGYYRRGDRGDVFVPVTPTRVLDSRDGTGTRAGIVGRSTVVDLSGLPDNGATSVVLNVTVTRPTKSSYLTLFPAGSSRPLASNLNWRAGETVANLVVVRLGAGQTAAIANNSGATHVVVDVLGYMTSD